MAAILNIVFPTLPSSYPRFSYSNKNSKILRGDVRKCGSHLTIRCVHNEDDLLTRKSFPTDFKFGALTSAIQTEGSLDAGGRKPSSWDPLFTTTEERKLACDSYHRYKEDVKLVKNMGLDVYRFSISWSRILPNGTGTKNEEGIKFYKKLIDEVLQNGIVPVVTLFHFDVPQALEDKYGGFMNEQIQEDFKEYARVCFEEFGDKVKQWITINEPQIFRRFGMLGDAYNAGDPFVISYNMLLAHAKAAKLYINEFKATQGGEIGFLLECQWFEPYSSDKVDIDAATRVWDFWMGWFLEPLLYGDYPSIMKTLVGEALPGFKDEEKELVKGSFDFIGFTYYTSQYAKYRPPSEGSTYISMLFAYQQADWSATNIDGKLIGPRAYEGSRVCIYPEGLRKALVHMKELYNFNSKIIITGNGYPEKRDDTLPLNKALEDDGRIKYMFDHLYAVRDAMREGVIVKGFYVHSMMDMIEPWVSQNVRYGLNYVDFTGDLTRYPKKSAKRLHAFLQSPGVESRSSAIPLPIV